MINLLVKLLVILSLDFFREMEESKQQGNAGLAMTTASNSCLTGVDLDRDGSLIQIKVVICS